MGEVVLKFANDSQYQQFIQQVKDEVIKDLGERKPKYSPNWLVVRSQIEQKLRGEYDMRSSKWSTAQQGVYSVFKLAFKIDRVEKLMDFESDRIQQFYDDLFDLIDKYRVENN